MPYDMGAKCPCCGVEAGRDINEIEEIFGFRELPNGKKSHNPIVWNAGDYIVILTISAVDNLSIIT
ncbi:hypothetical protein ILP31_17050 [Pectobacterium punjabense]|uniref:hypothetical protein n=1 Tax=Pectobacterium punjabense TaxID=2108399 RepID=UPI001BFF63DA|nr:hypothetical protein [Pectobacterium punjabense]MBT9185793.1 hypothetical protein [Pectobacterium punjabense]